MKPLSRLLKNKRAITGLVLATVIALIVITIIVPIGIILTYNLGTVATSLVGAGGTNTSTAAANASANVFTTAWQAYNLAAIMSIVAAAGAIITIIVVAFTRIRTQ